RRCSPAAARPPGTKRCCARFAVPPRRAADAAPDHPNEAAALQLAAIRSHRTRFRRPFCYPRRPAVPRGRPPRPPLESKVVPVAWIVHKFGCTIVADARWFDFVASMVTVTNEGNCALVVSAMRGMSDQLLLLIVRAVAREPYADSLAEIESRYSATV